MFLFEGTLPSSNTRLSERTEQKWRSVCSNVTKAQAVSPWPLTVMQGPSILDLEWTN